MVYREDYTTIPNSNHNVESRDPNHGLQLKTKRLAGLRPLGWMQVSGGLLFLVAISIAFSRRYSFANQSISNWIYSTCTSPVIRREWRNFSEKEKDEYFRAVHCLRTKPSILGTNHSLYDDFGYIHIQIGEYAHETAGFLAWHRYFIHIYERALKEQCEYPGHLAYWDWELDWDNIEKSPIWASENGFGGDGKGDLSVGEGRCVTDGPFANMTIFYYEYGEQEHCLSRGFRSGVDKDRFVTSRLHPDLLQETFDHADYRTFNLALEDGAHRAIPAFIQGEFGSFTSPNDPIFFLHHTQLDRLWWKWQQIDPQRRLMDYHGKAGTIESSREASMNDLLHVSSMGPAIAVSEIMSTQTKILCYIY